MADKKISALTSGSPPLPTDLVPIARGGANYRLPLADFANLNVLSVKAYGAKGDRVADDTAAIQAAIDAAAIQGGPDQLGGVVYFPPGEYFITSPLVLPRTGASPQHVVHLIGAGIYLTRLWGLYTIATGRSVIEWASTATQAWHQRIANMSIICPEKDNTTAIHFQPTSKSTWAAIMAESLQIDLENVHLIGSNQYQRRLVHLEGNVKASSFVNVIGDPTLGTTQNYDTICLETDTDDLGVGGDSSGLTFATVRGLFSGLRGGGYSAAFKGRMCRGIMQDVHCEQARSTPGLDLVNSIAGVVDSVANEGGGSQPQLRLTNCLSMVMRQVGIGSPVDWGLGRGNGIELIGVRDSTFDTAWATSGQPSFNSAGRKFLTLDANCKRNRFSNFTIAGTLANEVTNGSPDSAGNSGDFYDITGGAWHYMGTRLHGAEQPPILATGAGRTVDDVIAALQALKVVRQS